MNYIFFDIECANCFQGQGKICSFGYVITDEEFNIIEKRDIVINPRSKFHLVGHGNHPGIVLAYEEAVFKAAPTFPNFYKEIRSLLQDKNSLILGFSVMSDANYIKSECSRYELEMFDYDFIDVQRIYTDMHSLTNTPSLIKCASEYNIAQSQDVHKSDDDALLTMRVMKAMCEATNLSVRELIKKYPHSKCWCKDGELDCEFATFRAIQRANKLSKMEVITGSKRTNWMYAPDLDNHRNFASYATGVFVNYSSKSPLCGKRICISNLYEEFHFAEMMNIVSALAKVGVRYSYKPNYCDIFVTYELKGKHDEEYECYRLRKALRLIESGEKHIEFISFKEFLEMLELKEEELSTLDYSTLSPLWKKTPVGN
ncbi:MAG: hypothetical protein IJD42_05535 [Clostridia bacterium]|nr:hypothetical protein [Clostridia bacterium]